MYIICLYAFLLSGVMVEKGLTGETRLTCLYLKGMLSGETHTAIFDWSQGIAWRLKRH